MSTLHAEPKPPRPWLRWLPAAGVLGLLLGWYGQGWSQPTRRALGSAWSEAPGHLWGLWTSAAGLWQHGPLLRVAPGLGFPEGFEAHLVDPVSLLLFLPGYWLGGGGVQGAVLGWNLLHAGALVIGALGCVALARALAPDEPDGAWSAALLTAAFCGGAFLLSHPHMGRSEYLPAVLMPAQLALTLRWVRGQGGWRSGVGAGLLLGGVGLGGSYIAIFAALLLLPLGLGLLVGAGRDWRGVLARLALVAGLGLLLTAPMVWALLAHPPQGGAPLLSAPGRLMPEADPGSLLTLLRLGPRPELEPLLDQPPYPGVVLLALAILGAALRPRRAGGWLLLGLWLLALSLGPALAMQSEGQPAMIRLPAGWLVGLAPPLGHLKAWSRLGCLLPLPLGIAALMGVQALFERIGRGWQRAGLGLLLVLLVLADQGTWPRAASLERPVFEPAQPEALAGLLAELPEGAILPLPLEVSVGRGVKLQAARSHLWQLQHGRPITATPGVISDSSLRWSALARLAVNRQFTAAGRAARRGPPLPGAQGPLDPEQIACARADAGALNDAGIAALVLMEDQPASEALFALLEPVLGPPSHRRSPFLAWALAPSEEAPCSLPPVPPKVHMMISADGGDPAGKNGAKLRDPWGPAGAPAPAAPRRKPAGP
jgi:hypothetical protein